MNEIIGYVYLIYNKVNGKIYIGQHHSPKYDRYFGGGILIKEAIRKYGKQNFEKYILEYCTSLIKLNKQELYWINYYESCNPIIGYNLKQGGCCNVNKETKIKLSKAHKNKTGPNTNKVSIQRNYQRKFIFKEDLDKYLKEGWYLYQIRR